MDETELVALFGVYAGRLVEEAVIGKANLEGLEMVLDDGAIISYKFPPSVTRAKKVAAHKIWQRYVRNLKRS